MNISYPLSAIVGQEDLKLALILNAINPAITGVLIRGEKGTAKSTAVRGLAELMPEIEVVEGCPFGCDPKRINEACDFCYSNRNRLHTCNKPAPFVTLPLNVTEDRVAGGIEFSATIKTGRPVVQAGILACAHRGILYIDEINLLDDHIVDLILNAAASGKNIIEREGISFSHPSRFILIATMNPEEGELRPQLMDRFGLCIEVNGCRDIDERIVLLERREEFDLNPEGFRKKFQAETIRIKQQILKGRKVLPCVGMTRAMRNFIGELCLSGSVAGHRADIILEQAALGLAALEGKNKVGTEHIRTVAPMVLIHRRRDANHSPQQKQSAQGKDTAQQYNRPNGLNSNRSDTKDITPNSHSRHGHENAQASCNKIPDKNIPEKTKEGTSSAGHLQKKRTSGSQEQIFEASPAFKIKTICAARDRIERRGSGRRSRSRVSQKQGYYTRACHRGIPGDIAFDATIRAAAPFQKKRRSELALQLLPEDFRYRIREKRLGNLLLFLVDASGSMGARGRMAASKGAIMSLLLDAYQKRDKVAMISFRKKGATVNLPVTRSVEIAGRLLAHMPIGGRTPVSAGLAKAYELVRSYLAREPTGQPIVFILTDGKANVSIGHKNPVDEMLQYAAEMRCEKRTKFVVIDTEEEGVVNFGLARKLAASLQADYFKIHEIEAEELVHIVREIQ